MNKDIGTIRVCSWWCGRGSAIVLVFWDAQKSTTDRVAYAAGILFLSSGSSKSELKMTSKTGSLESCKKESVPCLSSSFWWFDGHLWQPLACTRWFPSLSASSHSILPSCISVSKFPLLVRTPVRWDYVPFFYIMSSCLPIVSVITLFPNKVRFWGNKN